MSKKTDRPNFDLAKFPLPSLPSLEEVQRRLGMIFPSEFPNRGILVGTMSARVIFVFLYGGFIEGQDRFLRPAHVYFFTEEQAGRITDGERFSWLSLTGRQGYRPEGKRWYANTSREPIRDDLMRNRLYAIGIIDKLPGYSRTSMVPIYYLSSHFANLFDPKLTGHTLDAAVARWQREHLDPAILQRMRLRSQGVHAQKGDVLVDMPDGSRIRLAPGESSLIAKGVIEDFTKKHMTRPMVLWISASDKKAYPQFVELAASVGLRFDLNAELPDLILVDTAKNGGFVFCEVVATDGAVTETRKKDLLAIVLQSNLPETAVQFLTAFEDRETSAFRKNFSQLAVDSLVWFRTEPDLLMMLTRKQLCAINLRETD